MNIQNQYQTTAPGKEYPTPTCITTSHQNTATTMFCHSPLLLIEMRRNISLLFVIHIHTQGIDFCHPLQHSQKRVNLWQSCSFTKYWSLIFKVLLFLINSYEFRVTKWVSSRDLLDRFGLFQVPFFCSKCLKNNTIGQKPSILQKFLPKLKS